METIRIAVVGLGRMGAFHAASAARGVDGAVLAAVCDTREGHARVVAADLGCAWHASLEELLAREAVDAVVVATPSGLHGEPVRVALAAGKAVFCEKPLASTLPEALALERTVQESGLPFMLAFNRRFDPVYRDARRRIVEGEIGRPVHYTGFSRDPYPPPPWACDPEQGGGLFLDMMVHDFDCARFLLADEVVSVFAREANLVVESAGAPRFADNVTASLRFRGGALASCHASMHASYGYDIRGEVYGETGCIAIGDLGRLAPAPPGAATPHFITRFRDSYVGELADFVRCLRQGASMPVTERDGVAAMRIARACIRSASEGVPVDLAAP